MIKEKPKKSRCLSVAALPSLILLLVVQEASADSQWTVRTLIHGTAIQSTNGIAVGPDGYLYVATVFGREIAIVNRKSGAIVDRLGPEDGVETPDDLVFGPDGSLFWTSPFTGDVKRRRPDGEISTIARLPLGVNPIAFNTEGRLVVALVVFNDFLYELDPEGVLPPRLILEQPGNLNGFAFGPDGFLYAPQGSTRSVVRIDLGNEGSNKGILESFATGFTFAAAVDFDSLGRLYVNDSGAGEIVRIDLATGERELFATLPRGADNFSFDEDDNLYVTSLLDSSIIEVRPDGSRRLVQRGGMSMPGGLTMVSGGGFDGRREELLVADFFTLRAFSTSGRPLREERSVPLIDPLTFPNTVAAHDDRLILTSWLGNAVQVFDPARREVVVNLTDFAVPLNAIVFQGDLVVAELGTGSVVRASRADPAQRTVLASGLFVPAGLAATEDDLWVTDQIAGTLLQLAAGGHVFNEPQVVAAGLAMPEGLAVLPDGDLVVVEAGAGRVSRVDPASGAVSAIAENLRLGTPAPPHVPPTWYFNGVTVDSRGALYVTGDEANVIYRLQQRGKGRG